MDQLSHKSFTTTRDLTYTYYVTSQASSPDKPTIVLYHGFPDSAHLWAKVVPSLLKLPFPLFIPDLLGYAGTSKPTDPSLYSSKAMVNDIFEILERENIRSIVSLGHDWGCYMASRTYQWHPERVAGLICLNVAYAPPDPSNKFDLDAINKILEQHFGAPLFAYWELFTAPDGAEVIENHLESFWTVLHGDEPNWMHKMFCVRGAMREYLLADKRVPLKTYAQDPELKDGWISQMKRGGLKAPLQWYCSRAFNHQYAGDLEIPKENYKVKVPHLFIGCTGDAVCRKEQVHVVKDQGFLPDLTVVEIESAHWSPLEKPAEISQALVNFLEARF